jgi:hypothetical protein
VNADLLTRLAAWVDQSRGRYVRLGRANGLWYCTLRHPTTAGPCDVSAKAETLPAAVEAALAKEAS